MDMQMPLSTGRIKTKAKVPKIRRKRWWENVIRCLCFIVCVLRWLAGRFQDDGRGVKYEEEEEKKKLFFFHFWVAVCWCFDGIRRLIAKESPESQQPLPEKKRIDASGAGPA